MDDKKKLMKGEIRFIPKKWEGNVWGVYDRAMASWPHQNPEVGKVLQQVSKADAEAEARRLNILVGIDPDGTVPTVPTKAVKSVKDTKPATKTVKAKASTEIQFEAVEIPEPVEAEAYDIEEFGASNADELAAKYEGAYL